MSKPLLKPKMLGVRLTDYLSNQLDRYSLVLGVTKTDLVMSAISVYISQLEHDSNVQARMKDNASGLE